VSPPLDQYHDRRAEPRRPAAFAFWFAPAGGGRRASAWMLNYSTRGAAFLTAAQNTPRVGDRIRLTEMYADDPLIRQEHLPLPQFARVLRCEEEEGGATRRVAVRFETDVQAELGHLHSSEFAAACRDKRPLPIPPPMPSKHRQEPGVAVGARR